MTLAFIAVVSNITLSLSQHALADDDSYRPPAIQTEDVPVVPKSLIDDLSRYQNIRSASFAGWAPNGQGILVATRFGNTTQLHRVYKAGGRREQVTFFEEPVRGRFIPGAQDGSMLVSLSSGGNEAYQVYRVNPTTGETQRLTDGKSRNVLGAVSTDGSHMAVTNNSRNGRDMDIYFGNANEPNGLTRLMPVERRYWTVEDWSAGHSKLLINNYVSINESHPAVFNRKTKSKLSLHEPYEIHKVAYTAMKFDTDGETVYAATDIASEFRQLTRIYLNSRKHETLVSDIPWDVTEIAIEPASGLVAFATNEDAYSGLYVFSPDSVDSGDKQSRRLKIPEGIVRAIEWSPKGDSIGFTLSGPDHPSEAYSIEVASGKLTRWTYSEIGGLDQSKFVRPKLVHFKTFDDRSIPAFYFKPPKATADNPAPVILNIHGGPESQYRPYFSNSDQFYLNELGIAVIRPNVRGSRGYGKSYLLLDNAEKREDSVRDIGALLDWIAKQPELDADRIAVYGGSYGGYMVLSSLTHYSDRIRCGVDLVGIASFASFLKNTSEYRRDLRRAEYGDERDPKMAEVFRRIDPVNNAHKIKTALLVAHGRNDPRVPFSEAEQIAPKVRANGQTVWTVYADNEGHGFRKKANRDYVTAVTTLFFQKYLTD
ncbi:MAG: peptidase S9 [Planctomycetaceae bacterium]|nr:peptidase S9 [Planctomycetaceae bacterium]